MKESCGSLAEEFNEAWRMMLEKRYSSHYKSIIDELSKSVAETGKETKLDPAAASIKTGDRVKMEGGSGSAAKVNEAIGREKIKKEEEHSPIETSIEENGIKSQSEGSAPAKEQVDWRDLYMVRHEKRK